MPAGFSFTINFIPLELWQLKVLLMDEFQNSSLLIAKLSGFLILISRLLHSITVDQRKGFKQNYAWHWTEELVLYALPVVGISLCRLLGLTL